MWADDVENDEDEPNLMNLIECGVELAALGIDSAILRNMYKDNICKKRYEFTGNEDERAEKVYFVFKIEVIDEKIHNLLDVVAPNQIKIPF